MTGDRSSTDRTSNVMRLAGADLGEDLPRLLVYGRGPARLLSPFLHESVHHWCNNSLVGSALALVQFRIHRAAMLSRVGELANAMKRYETALALLRPLDEGLALFAEFDVVSRETSRVWSQPLELASFFFQPPPLDAPQEFSVTVWAQAALQRLRLGTSLLDRKADVLGRPLSCRGDGYLGGYLLVRQLWLAAITQYPRFAVETDLFLMYLRSFLYDDLGLVATLLDDQDDGPRRLTDHIVHRLRQFSLVQPYQVDGFESFAALPSDQSGATPSSLVAVRRLDAERGSALLESEFAQLARTDDAALRLHEQQVVLKREFLYVGSWPARIAVTGDSRYQVLDGDKVVYEGTAAPSVRPGHGNGVVEVLQWIPHHERVCAVYRDGELIAAEQSRTLGRDLDLGLLRSAGLRDSADAMLRSLDGLVTEVVDGTSAAVDIKANRVMWVDGVDDELLPLALADTSPTDFREVCALTAQYGLLPLLDDDRELVEGAAAIGIAAALIGPYATAASGYLEHRGLDYRRVTAALDELSRRYGVGRLFRSGDLLLSAI